MKLLFKHKLLKLQKKNRGNKLLIDEINILIKTIEDANWQNKYDILKSRVDADCVHNNGFYFFNISAHRCMVLIVFMENEASVIWTGSHKEYEREFKNNKNTIVKWLRKQQLI